MCTQFWPKLSPTKQAFYLREMLNVIGALVEHENGFSYARYQNIVLLSISKIFECMESPHFQVSDQALSLWKDTVMLYLSKCQKELIWRRLFIIFKDIQLNHWNAAIKQLANEVVLYYERIDFEYWKKLKLEYEDNVNDDKEGQAITTTTTATKYDDPKSDKIMQRPHTLVPSKYNDARLKKLNAKKNKRVMNYNKMREVAMKNKVQFDEEVIVTSADNVPNNESHIKSPNEEEAT